MQSKDKLNLTMLCDFYELTMGSGYFQAGLQDRITYFDVFFRDVPDKGGFAVCEDDGGEMRDISLAELPEEVREGDVLVPGPEGYRVDAEETRRLREENAALFRSLLEEP